MTLRYLAYASVLVYVERDIFVEYPHESTRGLVPGTTRQREAMQVSQVTQWTSLVYTEMDMFQLRNNTIIDFFGQALEKVCRKLIRGFRTSPSRVPLVSLKFPGGLRQARYSPVGVRYIFWDALSRGLLAD
jgi:hypothetical protein